jgi:hypothetical protein
MNIAKRLLALFNSADLNDKNIAYLLLEIMKISFIVNSSADSITYSFNDSSKITVASPDGQPEIFYIPD